MGDNCIIQIDPIKFDLKYSCPECGDKGRVIQNHYIEKPVSAQGLSETGTF